MTLSLRRFVWLGSLLLLFTVDGLAQKKEGTDKVLFTIDGQPTTKSEFLYLFGKNNQVKPTENTEASVKEYFDLVLNFKLKVAEAHDRGIDTTRAFVREFTSYRDELKKPFVASTNELDRLVKEAYDRMKEEVKAAHILVMLPADPTPADTLVAYNKISAIRQRVLNGEDFSKVAAETSEEPNAKMSQGMLGYFSANMMVYQFEDAAYRTPPGSISSIVRTRFGYHVLKVFDRRPASGEVEVSHILFGGTDAKSRNKAFEVFEQLKGGRSWDDLCKEYSEDTNTKDRGGRLPVFGPGALAGVPEFERVAFSLTTPGEVSDPFMSNIGWHIVRLERKIPVPTFEEASPNLKRQMSRDERLQVSQGAQFRKRKLQAGFKEMSDVKAQIEALADTSLQRGHWNTTPLASIQSQALFSVGSGKPVLVKEFLAFVKEVQRPSALSPHAYFNQLYDQFVERHLNEAEDASLQATNSEYRNLVREYKEGIMFFSIMEQEVWNKGSADTTGQRAYYEHHKDKYQAGERLKARFYATPDKAFFDEVKAKIARGDSITASEVKKFKTVTPFRAFAKGDSKVLDSVPWVSGVHETDADGIHYLVEVESLLPPGQKSFQEARASVISDYQEEIEKAWVASLQKKHTVKQNKKAIKQTVQELTKK